MPVSFSTHRNAGMSSLEPSRIPPGWRRSASWRSGLPLGELVGARASQRAMFGALPSRIARRSTGSASPSISRKMIPACRCATGSPWRRAIRLDDPERVGVVVVGAEDNLEHDDRRRDHQRRQQRPPERVDMDRRVECETSSSIRASSNRIRRSRGERERQPKRRDDRRQDRVQRRDHERRDQRVAEAPDADARNDRRRHEHRQPAISHETSRRSGRSLGTSGST